MFAKQEAKRERENPLARKQQAAFGRALLAKLEGSRPLGPARVAMTTQPPLENDRIPGTTDPEPIGGCFADIAKDPGSS